ncbi:MAG: hypothetical protein KDJ52_00130 [Anaerolineae bacterium]|nr:hypothetical protein [Anaerolineae bacterium]
MPKMTAKYRTALETALKASLPVKTDDQETLYALLQENGYFWDSRTKSWDHFEPEEADDPTPLIYVRVWADEEIIHEAADDIVRTNKKHWQLVERSDPYRCRPPKQREARIYLRFLPKRNG